MRLAAILETLHRYWSEDRYNEQLDGPNGHTLGSVARRLRYRWHLANARRWDQQAANERLYTDSRKRP
jgi:hypothetical protein